MLTSHSDGSGSGSAAVVAALAQAAVVAALAQAAVVAALAQAAVVAALAQAVVVAALAQAVAVRSITSYIRTLEKTLSPLALASSSMAKYRRSNVPV